jgi:hypothetical protein
VSIDEGDSVHAMFEMVRKKAPETLGLFTAKDDEQFDAALIPFIEWSVRHLEENKKILFNMEEVGLSAFFVARISMPGLTVTQERHSNGHVDITIEADHCTPVRKRLAEAKIYRGPEYHVDGVEQLIGRYSTGRDKSGLMITYVKRKNIERIIEKIRDHMDENLPHGQTGKTKPHVLSWSFNSVHIHNSGALLRVDHIGCNLHVER